MKTDGAGSPRCGTLAAALGAAGFMLAAVACSAAGGGRGSSEATSVGSGSTSSAGSTGATSSGAVSDDCTTLCATEATLGCSDAGAAATTACVLSCEYSKNEVTWCTPTSTAATDCLAKQPASSFSCVSGAASANAGVCSTELSALTSCWYDGPAGGLPDLTQACATVCKWKSALSCADPNCVTSCEADVKPGAKCNGAFAALVACASVLPPSDFVCDTESPPQANIKEGLCPFEGLLLYGCLNG
jgi:hypothetical protein